ncbi:MAG: outer membrane lipoprotein carrier protein LolA [Candidatus Margulisiibacteriota bacterium]
MKKYSLVLALLFLPRLILADTTADILKHIKEQQDKVQDFKAYYTQTVTSSLMKDPQVESGVFYKKGDQIRKETQKPSAKLLITTRKYVIEKDLSTGRVSKLELSEEDKAKLSPEEAISKFDFKLVTENATSYFLSGTYQGSTLDMEVTKGSYLTRKLVMTFNQIPMTLLMDYAQTSGNIYVLSKATTTMSVKMGTTNNDIQMVLSYKDIKSNVGLSDSLFDL